MSYRPGYTPAWSHRYGFGLETWPEIVEVYARGSRAGHPVGRVATEIVESIVAEGASTKLVGSTTMDGLVIRPTPIPEPPYDVVQIAVHDQVVVITHLSRTGNDDRIERPTEQAVRLFWRFMIEKYDIHPDRDRPVSANS